jgi:thiol-disulfide isomerase/thioredoxin
MKLQLKNVLYLYCTIYYIENYNMAAGVNIKDIQAIANDYGGKCLSKEYISTSSPLAWMCSKGHTWDSSYLIIQQGGWCRQCAKNEEYLVRLDEIAESKGGKCLAENYHHSQTKLPFQCAKGHKFLMTSRNILTDHWCLECHRIEEREKQFNKIKALAKKKGGECISSNYVDGSSRLKFQCSQGHTWSLRATAFCRGFWCKICSRNEVCAKELKKLQLLATKKGGICLSEKFVRIDRKLKWQCDQGHVFLMEPKSLKKGYWCQTCGLKKAHMKIRKYTFDDIKRYAERKGGIVLSKEFDNPAKPLKWQCKEGHIWSAVARPILDRGTWCIKCHIESTRLPIEELKQIAIKRGGILLSNQYTNSKNHLKWQCDKGHVWLSSPGSVKSGTWCPTCKHTNHKITVAELRQIAKERKGKLLSSEYVNSETHLWWQCKNKHQWKATSHTIKAGSWCPKCRDENNKLTIGELQAIAKKQGGKLLSTKYIDSKTPLEWGCANGHTWLTAASTVKKGSWCRKCSAEKRKLTIEMFQKIAKKRGGKLLSDKYVNSKTPLKWECREGHRWTTTPIIINQGSWCPVCGYKRK